MNEPDDRAGPCGGRVVVRRWRRVDLDEAASWAGGTFEKMPTEARDEYFEVRDGRSGSYHFAVEDASGRLAGLVGISDIHETGRIAYNLTSRFRPDAEAAGLAVPALRVLLRWCFDQLKLLKVCAVVPATDVPLLEVHRACGFEEAWDFWQPAPEDAFAVGTRPTLDRTLSYVKNERNKTYVKHVVMELTAAAFETRLKEDEDVRG